MKRKSLSLRVLFIFSGLCTSFAYANQVVANITSSGSDSIRSFPNPFINTENDQVIFFDLSVTPLPSYNLMYNRTLWHDSERPLAIHTDDDFGSDYHTFDALNDGVLFNFDECSSISLIAQYFQLNKKGDVYNNVSVRSYHYKKKYDVQHHIRATGGVNELSLNLGQNRIAYQNKLIEVTFNYGAGFGGMLTSLELEGAGRDYWENGDYTISTKKRKGYQFQGVGGNVHAGFTLNFKVSKRLDVFLDVEVQSHFHHLRKTTAVWHGPELYHYDGSLMYSPGEVLYDSAYNAFGVAGIIGYGMHYRF